MAKFPITIKEIKTGYYNETSEATVSEEQYRQMQEKYDLPDDPYEADEDELADAVNDTIGMEVTDMYTQDPYETSYEIDEAED